MEKEWHIEITKDIAGRAGIAGDTTALVKAVMLPDKDKKRFPDRMYHIPLLPCSRRMRRTIRLELETAIRFLNQGNREEALAHLGYGFHALQDLVSHKSILHSAVMHVKGRAVLKRIGIRVRDIDDYEKMPKSAKKRLDIEMTEYAAAFVEAENIMLKEQTLS